MNDITLVIPSLTSGGAERVMATMANYWANHGKRITLLTMDDGAEPPFYALHDAVCHRQLRLAKPSSGAIAAIKNNIVRIRALRRAIVDSRPEAVISFLDTTNVATLIATRGLGIPVIVEEHTDPAQKSLGGGWKRLRRALYPRADHVVVLSNNALAYFPLAIRKRASVIPNPIAIEPPSGKIARGAGRTLIAMGRFGPEKGFDLLLDAFARIADRHPCWNLVIWGDGNLRIELENQRDRLGLAGRVSMPGRTQAPHDELRRADLFVMSSRREGFPMALGEAMACGLPAVSTDCPSGPRQIIRPGVDGLLVPPEDANALAAALDQVMGDDALRARLAAHAPEVLDRFGLEPVMARWDELLEQTQRARQRGRLPRFRTFGVDRSDAVEKPGAYDAR